MSEKQSPPDMRFYIAGAIAAHEFDRTARVINETAKAIGLTEQMRAVLASIEASLDRPARNRKQ